MLNAENNEYKKLCIKNRTYYYFDLKILVLIKF